MKRITVLLNILLTIMVCGLLLAGCEQDFSNVAVSNPGEAASKLVFEEPGSWCCWYDGEWTDVINLHVFGDTTDTASRLQDALDDYDDWHTAYVNNIYGKPTSSWVTQDFGMRNGPDYSTTQVVNHFRLWDINGYCVMIAASTEIIPFFGATYHELISHDDGRVELADDIMALFPDAKKWTSGYGAAPGYYSGAYHSGGHIRINLDYY